MNITKTVTPFEYLNTTTSVTPVVPEYYNNLEEFYTAWQVRDELIKIIFLELNFFPKDLLTTITDYEVECEVLGVEAWEALGVTVDPAPSLPDKFDKIMNSVCTFFPWLKIKQLFHLVYMPSTINNKQLSMETMQKYVPFFKNLEYRYNCKIKQPYWFLISNHVIREKNHYLSHKHVIKARNQNNGIKYSTGKALEILVAQVLYTTTYKKSLFDFRAPISPNCVYVACKEHEQGYGPYFIAFRKSRTNVTILNNHLVDEFFGTSEIDHVFKNLRDDGDDPRWGSVLVHTFKKIQSGEIVASTQ